MADDTGTGVDWKSALNAGAGFGLSLFAPKSRNITSEVDQIEKDASSLSTAGKSIAGTGVAGVAPALRYLTSVASGNEGDIMAATAPERSRVLDQYDTARRALTTLPRGGGQASAASAINADQAKTMSTLYQSARTSGVKDLATLSQNLMTTGLGAEEAGTQALTATLQPLLSQEKMDQDSTSNLFKGLGSFISALIFA